jgi:heptosyltransferase-2
MKAKNFSHTRRILIRSANWVGDAVMTTPALRAIRQHFPGARITLLAKPWVLPVFEHNPHVDERLVYQAADRHRGLMGLWRLAKDLRQQRFDLAVLLQNAFEAALLAWLARIPQRLGFTTDGRSLLLTHRMRNWPALKKGHLVDYYLGLLKEAGFSAEGRDLELFLTPQERMAARRMLTDLGISQTDVIIGINPGATYGTAKRWPADRYIALSRKLIQEKGVKILVFGGPGEARLGQEIAGRTGQGCFNLCDRTTLHQAMSLIDCCRAFVTNDSGLMHVAAALNIPQVAVIGPTDPHVTGPTNAESRIVRAENGCERAPCLLTHCPIDHRCMQKIDMEAVYTAVSTLPQKGGTR